MSIEEIINVIDRLADGAEACSIAHMEPEAEQKIHENSAKALREAIALLKTHPDVQPNEPLTLEELRKMDSQPVWVKNLYYSDYSGWWIIGWSPNGYCVLASAMRAHMGYSVENYGIDWLAYRHPPKEDAELMAWLYGDLDETIDEVESPKEETP